MDIFLLLSIDSKYQNYTSSKLDYISNSKSESSSSFFVGPLIFFALLEFVDVAAERILEDGSSSSE